MEEFERNGDGMRMTKERLAEHKKQLGVANMVVCVRIETLEELVKEIEQCWTEIERVGKVTTGRGRHE